MTELQDQHHADDVWRCDHCAEEVEGSFDVCWHCGASRDGAVDPNFKREIDAAESVDADKQLTSGYASLAGASVAVVLTFLLWFLPFVVALRNNPTSPVRFDLVLGLGSFAACLAAASSIVAGWLGQQTRRPIPAAFRGGVALIAALVVFLVSTSLLWDLHRLPLHMVVAVFGGVAMAGAIAGLVGAIFKDAGAETHDTIARVQYSLRELLFLTVLVALFSACVAALLR